MAGMKDFPIRLLALIAAGPVMTGCTIAFALIVWKGGWPENLRPRQLDYIGMTLIGSLLIVGVIIVALAAVRFKGTGPAGTSIEINAEDHPDE